jgi:predicted metal-dependent hydrolase
MQFLGQNIAVVRKPFRRNLTLRMHPRREIQIICGLTTPIKSIENFLELKKSWILKNLQIFEQTKSKQIQLVFEPGQKFPLFGAEVSLRVLPSKNRRVSFKQNESELHLLWPEHLQGGPSDYAEDLKSVLQKFYRHQAELFVPDRVAIWSYKMGVKPNQVKLKNQTTRWGSCSSKGTINLNWRLIAAPVFVIDYLIVHELAHLKHMNHSQSFWDLVELTIADFRQSEAWLKAHGSTLDFLI